MLVYEVRPRKDHRGVDLISDALPFGRLWYGEPKAIGTAIKLCKVSQSIMQCSDPRLRSGWQRDRDAPAQAETGFAEIVSDDFPVLHWTTSNFITG